MDILPSEEGAPPSGPNSTLLQEVLFPGFEICLTQGLSPKRNGDGPIFSDLVKVESKPSKEFSANDPLQGQDWSIHQASPTRTKIRAAPSHRAHV